MSRQTGQGMTAHQKQTTQTAAGEKVISFWQSMTYVSNTILGVSVLTLPRDLAATTKSDAFSAIIAAALFTMVVVWLFTRLGQRFPGLTLVGYAQRLLAARSNRKLGRWLSLPLLMMFAVWWICVVAVVIRIFGEVQRSAVFPETPLWFMVGSMLLTGAFVARSRADVIGRLNEFLFPLIIIPLLLIGLSSLTDVEWTNVLPLMHMGWKSFLLGTLSAFFAYQGVSVVSIAMASYQQPQKALQAHVAGIGLVMILYILVTVSTIGVFGYSEVQRLMWPTLELVKTAPGIIFERVEAGFLAIWVVAVFTTVANLLTAIVHLISEYFAIGENGQPVLIIGLAVAVFMIAMWPSDVQETFEWARMVGLAGAWGAATVTPVLFLLAKVRGRGREAEGN